jgi:hypothetical protein
VVLVGCTLLYRRGRIEIVGRARLEQMTCECCQTARRKIDEVFSHHPQ